MSENAATNPEKEQRLGEVLAAFLQAEEGGSHPDQREWLRGIPILSPSSTSSSRTGRGSPGGPTPTQH